MREDAEGVDKLEEVSPLEALSFLNMLIDHQQGHR